MADTPFVSLYRRFRPGRFGELRGQDHVVRALQSAVRDGRVSHAYLFSGPRGTGKTSSARILAKALNCASPVEGEPCGVCPSCVQIAAGNSLDVHELDAASNNGVDAMRDLVAHAGLGTPGRWKIYIVDEVHMLSTAAANALLKTLEEPPSHVVFVLATTDPQKVPPTIRSRTQHLEFRLLGAETLASLLESVNESAGLGLDGAAVSAAVRRGRGSARDALSALDQVVAAGSSDAARPDLAAVVEPLAAGSAGDALVAVSALLSGGWGAQPLAVELIDDLRQVFLAALAPDLCAVSGAERDRYTALAGEMGLPRVVRSIEILGQALIDMREAPDAQVVLEIAVVRAVRPDLDSGMEALSERVAVLERSAAGAPAFPRPEVAGGARGVAAAAAAAPPVAAPAEPAVDVAKRPSLGALKRSREAAAAVEKAAAAVPAAPTTEDGGSVEAPAAPLAATTTTAAPSTEAGDAGAPGAPTSVVTPRTVDRDSLTEAWGDTVLRGLPARAKALYSAGRFVSVDDDGGAHFALPNAAHRDRCLELTPTVETKLGEHFGTPVRLVLDVDDAAPPAASSERAPAPPPRPAAAPRPSALVEEDPEVDPDPGYDDSDNFDPAAFAAEVSSTSEDQAKEAEARLLQAFPGASEVGS